MRSISFLQPGNHAVSGKKDKAKIKSIKNAPIDPNAPAGGGGPGYFKDPQCHNGPVSGDVPACTRPPAVRHQPPTPASSPPPHQKPPKTVPGKTTLQMMKTPGQDVEIYLEVLADGFNPHLEQGRAETIPGKTFHRSYSTLGNKGSEAITQFTAKLTITVQTFYGPDAKTADISSYGRGTTEDDLHSGNITLGFHESCHRKDFQDYVSNNPPQFSGKVGMPLDEFMDAIAAFQDVDDYFKKMEDESKTATDEVGYEESTFDRLGPRKT